MTGRFHGSATKLAHFFWNCWQWHSFVAPFFGQCVVIRTKKALSAGVSGGWSTSRQSGSGWAEMGFCAPASGSLSFAYSFSRRPGGAARSAAPRGMPLIDLERTCLDTPLPSLPGFLPNLHHPGRETFTACAVVAAIPWAGDASRRALRQRLSRRRQACKNGQGGVRPRGEAGQSGGAFCRSASGIWRGRRGGARACDGPPAC